jgi:hypothetical protein
MYDVHMEIKTCSKCGEEKTVDQFSTNGNRINSHCKACRARRYKDYYATDKEKQRLRARTIQKRQEAQEYVRGLKDNPCVDCGKKYPYYNMQFDHLGDKEWTIGRLVGIGATKKKIDAEIAKCELVCVLCHGDRTHRRRLDSKINDVLE